MGISKDNELNADRAVDNILNNGNSSLFTITEVTPDLLLCGASMLTDKILSRLNITCIISASPELPLIPVPTAVKHHYKINITDNTESDLNSHLDNVADLINKIEKEGGKTLVHCVAGVSRSVSLCLGYLIKYKDMALNDAFNHIHSKRPCIRPNNGFFTQLIDYEQKLRGTTTVQMVYNSGAQGLIPDVYEQYYYNTVKYKSRMHGNK
ncbi:hypothetical protein O3M35_003120 [Rhynocoris fuscipes]|uniref:Protein-tyrosine-phosphatase n=1 Tax=Rhynocoris fuscipes TaxID=488301 RepID=A0AAW1CJ88_9HEMI